MCFKRINGDQKNWARTPVMNMLVCCCPCFARLQAVQRITFTSQELATAATAAWGEAATVAAAHSSKRGHVDDRESPAAFTDTGGDARIPGGN